MQWQQPQAGYSPQGPAAGFVQPQAPAAYPQQAQPPPGYPQVPMTTFTHIPVNLPARPKHPPAPKGPPAKALPSVQLAKGVMFKPPRPANKNFRPNDGLRSKTVTE